MIKFDEDAVEFVVVMHIERHLLGLPEQLLAIAAFLQYLLELVPDHWLSAVFEMLTAVQANSPVLVQVNNRSRQRLAYM